MYRFCSFSLLFSATETPKLSTLENNTSQSRVVINREKKKNKKEKRRRGKDEGSSSSSRSSLFVFESIDDPPLSSRREKKRVLEHQHQQGESVDFSHPFSFGTKEESRLGDDYSPVSERKENMGRLLSRSRDIQRHFLSVSPGV
jgi:hypothetical protein